ncbi:MAG: hypothetical protein AB1646_11715 [Thermodesulfobacteriota bacterium]
MSGSESRSLETSLYVRFDRTTAETLRRMAREDDRSISALIRKLVDRALEVEDPRDQGKGGEPDSRR